jgi:hypothetical protein
MGIPNRCKGRLVGTKILQKKRKKTRLAFLGDNEDNKAHGEYPTAMNELDNNLDYVLAQEDSETENEEYNRTRNCRSIMKQ